MPFTYPDFPFLLEMPSNSGSYDTELLLDPKRLVTCLQTWQLLLSFDILCCSNHLLTDVIQISTFCLNQKPTKQDPQKSQHIQNHLWSYLQTRLFFTDFLTFPNAHNPVTLSRNEGIRFQSPSSYLLATRESTRRLRPCLLS